MIDLHLKAATEADMNAALEDADLIGANIDVIGEIPGAEGWHVNVRCEAVENPDALAAVLIDPPETPYRTWA